MNNWIQYMNNIHNIISSTIELLYLMSGDSVRILDAYGGVSGFSQLSET